jgi:hypothetical protein
MEYSSMKKLLTAILIIMLLIPFALAEEANISLGALLCRESAALLDRDGIKLTVTKLIQNGPEFFFSYEGANKNEWPVIIRFYNENNLGTGLPVYGFQINGMDYYTSANSFNDNGTPEAGLYLPANSENVSGRIIITPNQLPADGVFLGIDDIAEGAFSLIAYMPTTADLAAKDSVYWPEFFRIDVAHFDMLYNGAPLPEPLNITIPKLGTFEKGTEFFSVDSITLICIDAAQDFDFATFHPCLKGHAVLRNDTDHNVNVELFDVLIDGRKGGNFTLTADTVSAHCEAECEFILTLLEAMMPDDASQISLRLSSKDALTGKNVVFRTLVLTTLQQ